MSFKHNAKNNIGAKMTLLPCVLCGIARGMGSFGKHENGNMSVFSEFESGWLVGKANVLNFVSGL